MAELAFSAVRRPRRITVDTDGNVVTLDRIFVHRSEKGFVCVGLGVGGELLERATRMRDLPAMKRSGRGLDGFGDPYLKRLALLAKGYNPDEARVPAGNPGGGEWTIGGIVASAASAAASLFETDSASVVAGLATIASRLSAPTAFLGTLFIPTNRSLISSGAVPGNADVSFQFDRGTGVLTLSRSDDGTVLFSGRYDGDGIFRDANGNAFGRVVDGAVVLDPDALPGYASSSKPAAQSRTSTQAQSQTDANRNEPKLCPDPSKDRPGSDRSVDAVAHQAYVTGLPPGLAVNLTDPATGDPVSFDGCRDRDGTMLEAKGFKYERALSTRMGTGSRGSKDCRALSIKL
ncbi:MAG: hypothetical protein KGL11_08040 [Alphaproteobacteria bacterium]|nr:hypothetical protein [Alphaproteobacteria bacterium]